MRTCVCVWWLRSLSEHHRAWKNKRAESQPSSLPLLQRCSAWHPARLGTPHHSPAITDLPETFAQQPRGEPTSCSAVLSVDDGRGWEMWIIKIITICSVCMWTQPSCCAYGNGEEREKARALVHFSRARTENGQGDENRVVLGNQCALSQADTAAYQQNL